MVENMQELVMLHRRYEENSRWIGDHYERLKRDYEGEWVAVLSRSVIAHDKSFKRLLRYLRREFADAYGEVAVEYVTRKPLPLIL